MSETEDVCEYCRLPIEDGWHTPGWCLDWAGPEVVERVPAWGRMILPRPPADHDAYRAGLCCDCSTVPYSAGRPRCGPCHGALQSSQPGLEHGKLGRCALPGCLGPTVPGRVLCGPCRRSRKRADN